nr:PREDICTED: haloacid dehalogenase-like hydrolase domain-containing protein Sgpp isoform X3 [Fragaria vesca subsp. vesca]
MSCIQIQSNFTTLVIIEGWVYKFKAKAFSVDFLQWKQYSLISMELYVIQIQFTMLPSVKCFKRILFPDDFERGIKLTDDKEAMFRRLVGDKLKPVSGLDKVRKWVEDRGLKRAAVTNAPRPNAELMISILGLSDFFQAVILGSECEHAKPHPEPYLKGLEAIKASKEHTFIFEDSVSGIKAGVAAGMPVIALTTGNPEHILMEAKPSLIIKNYDDPKLWAALEELDKKSGTRGA